MLDRYQFSVSICYVIGKRREWELLHIKFRVLYDRIQQGTDSWHSSGLIF